ncbi:GNAT family N-acetyltransferase [Actinopolyspora erythraea]|uniref:Acetyltransferase n=1 Tax=Actinopolyspora erythraea TaxID=414996 RepID=A0A099D059_9ACTN|nr:GNAT family N-acetyltransferase [Actinopolyspora erythraea]ASU79707.1 GNAT family N-acetyltransferase [Actinopolyspora erythraea]KGI79573.1 acetyltransferase [Actinopolyspora erythraea]
MDPLHDPDDEELLGPEQARDLAALVERAQLASGAVREGRIGKVGVADVVLNAGNPLTLGNRACGLWGTSAEVATTLFRLENVFAEAGRPEAVVHASPTTVADIEGIADDSGWHAVAENVAMLYRPDPARNGTEAIGTHPVREAAQDDLPSVAELLADELDLSSGAERRLPRHLGQRLDDPRCFLHVLDDGELERVAGFALGFAESGVGLIEHIAVRPGRRNRGRGRALLRAGVEAAVERGSVLVATHAEDGGSLQRFAESCGFGVAYEVVSYTRGLEERFEE